MITEREILKRARETDNGRFGVLLSAAAEWERKAYRAGERGDMRALRAAAYKASSLYRQAEELLERIKPQSLQPAREERKIFDAPRPVPQQLKSALAVDGEEMQTCPRCKGKGSLSRYRHKLNNGVCFVCGGNGVIRFSHYKALVTADTAAYNRALRYRVAVLGDLYKNDVRIRERDLHPLFAPDILAREDGIMPLIDQKIELALRTYEDDPRFTERGNGTLAARQAVALAIQDGVFHTLETASSEENLRTMEEELA